MGILLQMGGAFAGLTSSLACIRCAVANPGILQAQLGSKGDAGDALQIWPSEGSRYCVACGIIQPRGTMHCEHCQVCILGWDHHCPWMSKCIGEANLEAFHTFLIVSFCSLGYVVICAL